MLYLKDKPLTEKATSLLEQYQKAVDEKPTFSEKVKEGKDSFSKYNKKNNAAFKEVGTSEAELFPLIESLKSEQHQTVWYEMIRQRSLHPELDDLFNRAPEALEWKTS